MSDRITRGIHRTVIRIVLVSICGLIAAGCDGSSDGGGNDITSIPLPTDTLLNLACENVGINSETCVLEDRENPYTTVVIREFDENNPGAENKFALLDQIPQGRTGAKARFYLWATALARFPSGENQYYTAWALHELWNYNEDPIVRDQALKAYRSVLDNFFGSVTFFSSGDFGLFPSVDYSVLLNELTAAQVSCSPDYASLLPPEQTDPFYGRALLAQWGYTYDYDGECANGVVYVNEFP